MDKKTAILLAIFIFLSFSALAWEKGAVGDELKPNAKGFHSNIEEDAVRNNDYRKVVYTGEYAQLVLMSIKPKEEIGTEVHPETDQFFRIEKGNGKAIINGNEYELTSGDAVLVPSGARHNIINTSETDELKLYTIYSPPHHKDGLDRVTKEDAEYNGAEFDGKTTE